jgi:hypothetical protein
MRVIGTLANAQFYLRPNPAAEPPTSIETAYHKADVATQRPINLLAAEGTPDEQILSSAGREFKTTGKRRQSPASSFSIAP